MIDYPTLTELNLQRDFIEAFGGYNHNIRIGDNEFYDMRNLTSAHYPVLSPRQKRGTYASCQPTPLALIEKDALCYVRVSDTRRLYFNMNGYEYDLGDTAYDKTYERTLTSMGAFVIIMPDKKYINTAKANNGSCTDSGDIEAKYDSSSISEAEVTFQMCRADGTPVNVSFEGESEPTADLTNGCEWLDTSSTPATLKKYSSTSSMWIVVATTYIKISASNIGKYFSEGDGVSISGVMHKDLQDLNSTMVIQSKGDDYIVVIGIMNTSTIITQTESLKVGRTMPAMDFIIESNNRLWGCRYGLNENNEYVNEIYASKLGNFKNWRCFSGISTDSYVASLGTDGQFTGAFSYLGQPVFFKENCLHMVYGSMPREYQIQDIACRGVQKGSHKSLSMVNEMLYYKSRTGICVYDGSLPTEISSALGNIAYDSAVGCGHKNKYYISMRNTSTNQYDFFVYDAEKNMWHKEDNLQADMFCSVDEEIYFIDSKTKEIRSIFGSGTADEEPTEWMAETGLIGCSMPDNKYLTKISMRLSMAVGTRLQIYVQYDSSGAWERVYSVTGRNLQSFNLPITPRRCDHLKLKIEGRGDAKIFSISKMIEQGSDVNV